MSVLSTTSASVLAALLTLDLVFRVATHAYYSDASHVMRLLKMLPPAGPRLPYYKKYDAWFAPLPFVWTWLDILVAVQAAAVLGQSWGWLLLTIWSGGRFRALQEFGHNAVHFALCPSHAWQWRLSDVFFQFPCFKRDMTSRQVTHTREHHRHPNDPAKDPNRARVFNGGMSRGMRWSEFHLRLLYPLTWRGFQDNILLMWRNSQLNQDRMSLACRWSSVALVGAALWTLAGWKGVVFGWLLPLLTSYPLFAWLSLLTEHRWFVEGPSRDRRSLEYLHGRPTDYRAPSGWLIRVLISPTSDAYHLVHSLYPGVRWNYLPALDRFLKITDPNYTRHASEGLFFSRNDVPSALSELRERLTVPEGLVLERRMSSSPIDEPLHE